MGDLEGRHKDFPTPAPWEYRPMLSVARSRDTRGSLGRSSWATELESEACIVAPRNRGAFLCSMIAPINRG